MKEIYMKSNNYFVVFSDGRFIITDRNLERVSDKSFLIAAEAINFAEDNYKGLV